MCRQAYLQCDGPQHGRLHLLKELKQQQVTLALQLRWEPLHQISWDEMQTAEGFGWFWGFPFESFGCVTYTNLHDTHFVLLGRGNSLKCCNNKVDKSTSRTICWFLCVVDRFGCILGQHFALAGNTLDIH